MHERLVMRNNDETNETLIELTNEDAACVEGGGACDGMWILPDSPQCADTWFPTW